MFAVAKKMASDKSEPNHSREIWGESGEEPSLGDSVHSSAESER